MNNHHIILASKSPRRYQLLKQIITNFDVITIDHDETIDTSLSILENLKHVVYQKINGMACNDHDVIIACDTMVVFDGRIIGKPKDKDDAKTTLKTLSGKDHEVISGVLVKTKDNSVYAYDCTIVSFHDLTDQTIDDYVASGRCMDKAGSYGIQDQDVPLVKTIDGDYDNVVGLPLHTLVKLLDQLDIEHHPLV